MLKMKQNPSSQRCVNVISMYRQGCYSQIENSGAIDRDTFVNRLIIFILFNEEKFFVIYQ